MSTPAIAGPIMRAALNEVELRPTAFESSASPTSSDTKTCRAGASNAVTHPSRNAHVYTCHRRTTPVTVSRPSASASTPIAACVAKRSFRRSSRSAARPVTGRSSTCGPNWSAITVPTDVALWFVSSVRTSQSCAVRCIHVPTFDTTAPIAHAR